MKKMTPHKTLKLIRKVKKVVEEVDVLLDGDNENNDNGVISIFKNKEQLRLARARKNVLRAAKKLDW